MTGDVITDGEANDLRARFREMDRRQAEIDIRINVHEQKCAARYAQIMVLLAVSIGINLPAAWPHIMTILGIVK